MNSLKYIEAEIQWLLNRINVIEKRLNNYRNDQLTQEDYREVYNLELFLNRYEEELNNLQQIKTELEAWYSIKSGLIYEKESKHRMSEEMRCAYTIYLIDDEIESIQKALEIKDE